MCGLIRDAGEFAPDLSDHDLSAFTQQAVHRALELGRREYRMYEFIGRDNAREAEDELIDAGNYAVFAILKDAWQVFSGERDEILLAEDRARLLGLLAQAIRLHRDWRAFRSDRSER